MPTSVLAGVPFSVPLELSKVAQCGLFVIENVSGVPPGLEALGVNEYGCWTLAEVGGVPDKVGA